ncbi:nucleotidyltransferase domain-containing protein [Bacillaceae bacterium SIJ1]|uniref:nucleotidyltransferase family protein n=1 Tax=Litoribacterium kuwaitense TaxID=1398745 RepID=UPI0013EDCE07|nr:nucleotidyltransferase domain-containing protein [Litoribacterium kuwaitense]NGP46230.1 nucleotidyltransferase domain-containing protein [Litoribacterium kuwaitense]
MFGLSSMEIHMIQEVLRQYPEIEKVHIFGSRALGTFKKGSDIDLVVYGLNVSNQTLLRVTDMLEEELPLPYFFDVVHYESIENKRLIQHIDEYGQQIYQKTT